MQTFFSTPARSGSVLLMCSLGLLMSPGCSEQGSSGTNPVSNETLQSPQSAENSGGDLQPQNGESDGASSSATETASDSGVAEFKPLSLSNLPENGFGGDGGNTGQSADMEKQIQSIIEHLHPLQILLGQWRGTTRREFENFKAVDQHEWVWDLRSDPSRPALAIKSDKSPYLKSARLSWDPSLEKFTMTATDGTGTIRQFSGDFSDPVHEIVGSDDKLHRVFRLELNQEGTPDAGTGESWQIALAQQENNRYLLEVGKRRGSAEFARHDTVSTQREGTSFAVSDTDYGEKTCIISEGLGTTEVTYKGRSYWVCCSGCKAAFEEDPEKWIARAAARDSKK